MHEHAEQQPGHVDGVKATLSESLSNVYLSVGSAGMIKGPSEFLSLRESISAKASDIAVS